MGPEPRLGYSESLSWAVDWELGREFASLDLCHGSWKAVTCLDVREGRGGSLAEGEKSCENE